MKRITALFIGILTISSTITAFHGEGKSGSMEKDHWKQISPQPQLSEKILKIDRDGELEIPSEIVEAAKSDPKSLMQLIKSYKKKHKDAEWLKAIMPQRRRFPRMMSLSPQMLAHKILAMQRKGTAKIPSDVIDAAKSDPDKLSDLMKKYKNEEWARDLRPHAPPFPIMQYGQLSRWINEDTELDVEWENLKQATIMLTESIERFNEELERNSKIKSLIKPKDKRDENQEKKGFFRKMFGL